MKILTKLISAAALSLSLAAVAAPSQASVFAQFSPLSNADNYAWTNSGPGNTGTGGVFSASGNVAFSFLDPALIDVQFALPTALSANFTVASGNPATFTAGPNTWTQTGLNGNFSLIYTGASQFYGTVFVTNGSNLLSGTIMNAWIQGNGGSGSTNLSVGNGGTLTYTSDYEQFLNMAPGSQGG